MGNTSGEMHRTSFIFYESFADAIEQLDSAEEKANVYRAIVRYSLYNEMPPSLKGTEKIIFTLVKPQIDANTKRYLDGCKGAESGKKGGRPTKDKTPVGITEKTPVGLVDESPNVNEKDNVHEHEKDNTNKKETVFANGNGYLKDKDGLEGEENLYGSDLSKLIKEYVKDEPITGANLQLRIVDISSALSGYTEAEKIDVLKTAIRNKEKPF